MAQTPLGTITGRIVNSTDSGKALGEVTILLQRWQGSVGDDGIPDTSLSLESEVLSKSDPTGYFSFTALKVEPGIRYIVQAGYRNVAYRSNPIRIDKGPTHVEIEVFETTQSPKDIIVNRASVAFPTVDEDQGLLGVLEVLTFENLGNRTYIGGLDPNNQESGVTKIHVPSNAVRINLGHGFGPDGFVVFNNGVINRAPLLPGRTEVILTYAIPYSETQTVLKKHYYYPVRNMTALIPASLGKVFSSRLEVIGPVEIDGVTNSMLNGSSIQTEQSVELDISGLANFVIPRQQTLSRETILKILLVISVILVSSSIVFYGIRRKGQLNLKSNSTEALDNLLEEQSSLIAKLAKLDDDNEIKKVPIQEYERLRYIWKRRLADVVVLLREQSQIERP